MLVLGLSHNVPLSVGPARDFVFKKAKETVMKKTLGLYPAPLKILEVRFFLFLTTILLVDSDV